MRVPAATLCWIAIVAAWASVWLGARPARTTDPSGVRGTQATAAAGVVRTYADWHAIRGRAPEQPILNMPHWVMTRLHDLTVDDIVRSRELNPREVPFSDAQIGALRVIVGAYAAHLTDMQREIGRTSSRELDRLAASGQLLAADDPRLIDAAMALYEAGRGSHPSSLVRSQLESGRRTPASVGMINFNDGRRTYYVSPSQLTETERLLPYRSFRCAEFADRLLAWLVTNAFLTPPEAADLYWQFHRWD